MVTMPFVPPTNAQQEIEHSDVNLASLTGLKVSVEELSQRPAKIKVTLDCGGLKKDVLEAHGLNDVEMVQATLECIQKLITANKEVEVVLEMKFREQGQEKLAARFLPVL